MEKGYNLGFESHPTSKDVGFHGAIKYMYKDKTTISCMQCLYVCDWTWADAVSRTMIKHKDENGLFLNAAFRQCYICKPKKHISPEPWNGLKEYYRIRGIHQ